MKKGNPKCDCVCHEEGFKQLPFECVCVSIPGAYNENGVAVLDVNDTEVV